MLSLRVTRPTLLDLFDGRRQLIVYRFFYEPGVTGRPERAAAAALADQVATSPT